MQKNEKAQKKEVHHVHQISPVELSQMSSTELKRNAKGEIEIRVKVYSSTPRVAMEEANKIFLALTKKHKYNQ